jgi:hypothetical protein
MDEGSSKEWWRRREDAALVAAGFEALEEQDLWQKGDTVFGRDAALQRARRSLPESSWDDILDQS